MSLIIPNDHSDLFEKIKENFEKKNYEKTLELAQELLLKNVSNEYLYQMISSIYFNNKEYEKAIKFLELATNKYGGDVNDDNLLKVMIKVLNDPDYDISVEYFKKHIIKMLNNKFPNKFDLLKLYIENESNNLENYLEIKRLYQTDKINRDTFIEAIFYMVFYKHIFNETNETFIQEFLKDELKVDTINDNILLEKINTFNNPRIFMIVMIYLTFPKILNLSKELTENNYNKIINNINKLIDICEFKIESATKLYTYLPTYYFYYLVYSGFNNIVLYQKVSSLFKKICPDLIYKSKKVENNINNKIKIGFASNLLFKNHSVCKDRIGIIKALIDDNRFDVYLFGNTTESEQIYSDKLGTFKNRIHISRNIKESREIIESYNLDILVYPEIGMDFFYWILAHSKLARVQINTWGHSETSGIDTIDYYISSEYYDDSDAQKNYSEKLIRLNSLCTYYYPLTQFDYYHRIINTDRKTKLFNFNLPTNCHLYGIFQSAFKYNYNNMYIIKKLLEKDQQAIIIILGLTLNPNRFRKFLEDTLGYQVNRIRLIDRLPTPKYHKIISCIDVILDSYPFGGCNTSLDSFNFNKIVVTLPSDKISGRFTHGFYKKMDIMYPIANNIDDFIDKAYNLASDDFLRTQIENQIKDRKNLLFEEKASIETWKEMLINVSIKTNHDDNKIINQSGDQSDQPNTEGLIEKKYIFHIINSKIDNSVRKVTNINNMLHVNPNLNPNMCIYDCKIQY